MIWVPYANITIITAATLALVGTFALTSLNEYTTTLHASLISIISGIGFGSSQTLAIIFSQTWVPKHHQSFVVSVALMVQIFGGTLGLVVGGSVLNTQVAYLDNEVSATQALAKSVQAVFYTCAAAATIAFLLAVLSKQFSNFCREGNGTLML
jgi:fucose permease